MNRASTLLLIALSATAVITWIFLSTQPSGENAGAAITSSKPSATSQVPAPLAKAAEAPQINFAAVFDSPFVPAGGATLSADESTTLEKLIGMHRPRRSAQYGYLLVNRSTSCCISLLTQRIQILAGKGGH